MSVEQPGRGPASPAGSTLEFLIGDWDVDRQICDSRSGRRGSFLGTAMFSPAPGVVWYTERGELRFGDHCGPASRTLLYAAGPGGAADVRFADGRDFFRLDLSSGRCQAEHQCGADRYQVTVTRVSQHIFTETWQVAGPAKNYAMTTRYLRTGPGAAASAGTGSRESRDLRTG